MMADRFFRQLAESKIGVNSTITVEIDGVLIYSGTVAPAPAAWPHPWPDYDYTVTNVACTWPVDVAYAGVQSYRISVTSGQILLAQVQCNNPLDETDPDSYGRTDAVQVGDEKILYPYITNIYLNGVAWPPVSPHPEVTGQGWFMLSAGAVWTADLHITASVPVHPKVPPT